MRPISSPCGEREKYLPAPAAARGEIGETLCEACCRVVDWFYSCPACRRSSPECFVSRRSRSLEAASSIAGRSSSARDSRTIRAPAYRVMICGTGRLQPQARGSATRDCAQTYPVYQEADSLKKTCPMLTLEIG